MWGDLMVRDNFEDLGKDWILILKQIFKKWYGRHGLDLSGSI